MVVDGTADPDFFRFSASLRILSLVGLNVQPMEPPSSADSHDGVPPSPSGRPAAERSVTTSHASTSPVEAGPTPPTAPVTDRPAGQNPAWRDEIPPPPPPPPPTGKGPVSPWAPEAPPARWTQPPMAAHPPRPVDPVSAPIPLSGPPSSPPPAPSDDLLPLGPSRRGWRVAAGVFAVLVLAASLVSAGYLIGSAVDDDRDIGAPEPTSSVRPAAVDESDEEQDSPALEIVPGPLAEDDAEEPVAAVARVVSPSVVLIRAAIGQGSGIVWDADEGYIVTNDHVIGGASTVEVQFPSGELVTGEVIGGDTARDIAVVHVDPDEVEMVAAVFAPTETVEVGQLAVAIGSPFDLDQTVTAGIVSAVNRITEGGSDPADPSLVEMIQTDAPINPGNSGGPLADRQGRVVGMNTQIRTSGGNGNIGVGFAVPSDTIVMIAQRIVDGESLELAFLGIRGETPTDGTEGAVIVDVEADTPAAAGGLEIGDRIVSLDGVPIASMGELAIQVQFHRPGETVEVEFVRDGERLVADVVLGGS